MLSTKQIPNILISTEQDFYIDSPQALRLESGQDFGPVNIRYECFGTLNSEGSNAILVLHSISGDAHAAGYKDTDAPENTKPGWWDSMIGPGKAIDTKRYYVICSNVLGGCMGSTGPRSTNPVSGLPYAMNFPVVTVQDMVRAQKALTDYLGIPRLYAVIGGSLGGLQALEWSIAYPDSVRSAIIIASSDRLSSQGIAFNAVGRNAITMDINWQNGEYYNTGSLPRRGLAIARMIGHITYLSDESMERKFGRRLQDRTNFNFDFEDQFQVESYLEYQGDRFVDRFDANSYIYLSKALDYYDLKGPYANREAALGRAQAAFLLISYSTDWLFPSRQVKQLGYELMHLGHNVSYTELDSPYGHDAFLLETARQSEIVSSFLTSVEG